MIMRSTSSFPLRVGRPMDASFSCWICTDVGRKPMLGEGRKHLMASSKSGWWRRHCMAGAAS